MNVANDPVVNQLQGGPGITPMPQGQTSTAAPVEQPNAEPTKTKMAPFYIGSKVFHYVEDLAEHTSQIESKLQSREFAPSSIPADANEPKVHDLMFSDPAAYTQAIREDSVNEALAIFDKRNAVQKLWDGFYNSHKDLADHRELVDFQYSKLKKATPDLPADQALVKVGTEVRAMLNKVRGSFQGGKELPTDPVIGAGASNGIAPTQVAAAKTEETSFIQELQQMKRRGK